MIISDIIRVDEKPKSILKKRKYKKLLKKDILELISEVNTLSVDKLKEDMHGILGLKGLGKTTESDILCMKYGLPLDGAETITNYLLTSYYFQHMYSICMVKEIYFYDPEIFSPEMKTAFLNVYLIHMGIFPILQRVAAEKNFNIISRKMEIIEKDSKRLIDYMELINRD